MPPYLNCKEGDVVFVRATVLEASSDCFKLKIEDYPKYDFTTYAPVREIAKQEDIVDLPPMRLQITPRFYG